MKPCRSCAIDAPADVRSVRRVRVAAIVHAPIQTVREELVALPGAVTSYLVETGAGVLVTLERERRWPIPLRRRVIRGLRRDLATIQRGLS